MAFQHAVWHVNATGVSYAGAEGWSMGFWLGSETSDIGVPTVQDANQLYDRVKAFFATSTVPISWAFVLNDLKIQHYAADGTMYKNNTVFQSGGAAQAGQATRNVPPQLALAISFRGAVTRGPGANGRMYIPGFVNIPTSSGHIESADLTAVSNAAQTMFNGINVDMAGRGGTLINASRGAGTPPTGPINVKVTTLRIGDVVDTIQRRRRGLREAYRTTAIA